MKKKVIVATLKEAAGSFPLAGDQTLNAEKHNGIEMWTGVEPGFLTVYYQQREVGIPLANIKSLVWADETKPQGGLNAR